MNPFKIGDWVRFDRTYDANCPALRHDQDHGGDTIHTVTGVSGDHILYLDGQRFACYWQRLVPAQAPAVKLSPEAEAAKAAYVADRQAAYDKWQISRALQVSTNQTAFEAGWQANQDRMRARWHAKLHLKANGGVRTTDPETSKQAAATVKVGKLNDRIIANVRDFGGGTAHAIAKRLGEPLNTVSPRMAKLVRQGWLHTSMAVKEEGSTAPRSYYDYNQA